MESQPLISLDNEGAHILSREVSEALEKKNLSPSLVTAMEGCGARWLGEQFAVKELIREDPDNAGRRGSLFHSVMEDFFTLPAEERTTAEMKNSVRRTLNKEEYADLKASKEAIAWLRSAINGYYNMGGKPQEVEIATLNKNGKECSGIEYFVKGNLGESTRPILGFVDQIIVDPTRDDGSVIVQDWKGLALNTLIPTPFGWNTMENVSVGDAIYGSGGDIVKVTKKSQIHYRPCFQLDFSSGESVVADNVHMWQVEYRIGNNIVGDVVNTIDLLALYNSGVTLKIKCPKPVDMPPRSLKVSFGRMIDAILAKDKTEISTELANEIVGNILNQIKSELSHESHGELLEYFNSKFPELDSKYWGIPEEIIFSSFEQRFTAFNALMKSGEVDTSGSGKSKFNAYHMELAKDFVSLISTFGVSSHITQEVDTQGRPVHSVVFATISDEVIEGKNSLHQYVSIDKVSEVPSTPTQCIGVDAEDSLFLFGKTFIITHNTGTKAKRWREKSKTNEGLAEQRQQVAYAQLLKQGGVNVSGARLIFPVAKEVVNVDLGNEKLINTVEENIKEADETLNTYIQNNTFEYRPSFLCAWCPLAKICPKAEIKPYDKMIAAYASQPEPEVLIKGIELN